MSTNNWYLYGKTYDLTNFLDKHPGGRTILELTKNENDITATFESYHSLANIKNIRKVLEYYKISDNGKKQLYTFDKNDFYNVCRTKVKEYFGNTIYDRPVTHKIKANIWWLLKTISIFFEKIEVVGLGRGNIKRIYDGGFDSIEKIMKMSIDDFLTVEGFKEKMATKVHNSIQKRLKEVELNELMAATNIFGRGMGARRIKKILDVYPDILTETESNAEKTEKISELPGFQTKTAKTFVPYIKKFLKFLKDSNLEYKLKDISKPVKIKKGHPLHSKKILFSGVRDKNLEKMLKEVGVEIASSVSKKLSYLIVKDIDQDTSKAEKAKKLGVKLITPNSFKNKYF